MSSPSTPRSTRSASPAGDSPNIITPGQKIKAMMAQFDSDSEEDTQIAKSTAAVSKLDLGRGVVPAADARENRPLHDSEDNSDSPDEVFRPKGRMASRLQGNSRPPESEEGKSAFARVSKAFRSEKEQGEKPQEKEPQPTPMCESSDDDDLPTAGPRRKHKSTTNSPRSDNRTSQTPPRSRPDSPLFVSSPGEPHDDLNAEDTENAAEKKPKGNARFLSLVAQKRKEREEREKAEAERKKAIRRVQMEQLSSQVNSGEESGADDPSIASKLSQKARQPRNASKKALDEMRQETQRMSRNMQLAHQAKTKKKITKESLFAKFNFMQPDPPVEQPAANSSSGIGSQNSSDAERAKTKDTPHTSPVLGHSDPSKASADSENAQVQAADVDMDADTEDLPVPKDLLAPNQHPALSKEPTVQDVSPSVPESKSEGAKSKRLSRPLTQPPIRVLLSRQDVAAHQEDSNDSDSDLEVVTSPGKCRRIAAFENLPTKQSRENPSMTKLKALAHLTSPTRKMASMNSAELSANLLWRARQQAAKERRERIEELRAKGVVIETPEERAAMEDDMENLVDKARKEADEIRRLEKAAGKKGNGDDDEEGDDDYELSGSDQEGDAEGDDEDDEENERVNGGGDFVEHEADEDDDSADDESEAEAAPSDAENEVPAARRRRRTRVVSDDEDEDQPQPPSTPVRAPNYVPQSAERPNFLGMGTSGDTSLGLTQAFASTLDGNGAGTQAESATMPFSLPDPGQPVPQLRKEESEVLVPDSQPQDKDFMEGYAQSVTRVPESPAPYAFSEFSQSQLPDPTQDEGFVFSPFDPAKRFRGTPPMSTVDTVLVGQTQSPIADRKRKMLRRGRATELPQVDENDNEDDFEISANAFDVMKKDKAVKKNPDPKYNKQNSKAKEIVDEAAEESEDEYAGLGGNSDESDGEENAIDRIMINDNSGEVVDEKQLAALNAVHDRNRDEKNVAKLMRDITTGALRRRKNADDDFDLDDSDDEHLARRREKQREFAKMRRALLADEKIGEIAENPKKAAFFKAVEDREVEEDFNIDFLEEEDHGSQGETSQDAAPREQSNDAASDGQNRKRPLEPSAEDSTNRPPPRLRRTPASAMSKKPATIAEIRETLSFLTETPEYDSFQEDASLDEVEHDQEDEETPGAEVQGHDDQPQSDNTFAKASHPRRTRGVVVDRLALLRQASSNSATGTNSGSANSKLAFHSGSGGEGPIGFRPPQLLRRVTNGSSSSSNSSASNRVSKAAASGPKKGGAVNSYTAAREREREKELRIKQRSGGSNIAKLLGKHTGGGLGGLDKGQWD
ncbi:unnamed protein product [Penicillium nalgiovense]|uniref:DNA replication checkpoint mediator MRC1 domain-containing protein n=1 Tax=Penicillium nalgiovense TaxID=60175 RepID=A0A9W4I616_PENNA|nr:unnamed protein product [Penicillium nalgiovense]CAG7958781.1 unnamed protein product [Penicillium nalgiovense]CAG7973482.1 unnamed protein product [Penicillium nalgiovense]CAG8042350.1 unnamed protein product [Penicillium nalgiovense]CAG8103364.1 unnamed protein product [Penicillium nalgiovense]